MRTSQLFLFMLFTVAAAAAVFFAPAQRKPSPALLTASSILSAASPTTIPAAPSVAAHSQAPAFQGQDRAPGATGVRMRDLKSALNALDFSAALAIADRLMEQRPDDTVALVRARVLISLGRKKEAFDALDAILSTSNDPEILHQAAARYCIVARDEGLISEALAAQQARINDTPDDSAMLSAMAQLYSYDGDQNNELRIRERLQAQQGSESNLARIAELQRARGLIEEASESVAALAAATDTNTAAHLLLKQAQTENDAGRADLAAETATRALALSDVSPFMTVQCARELEAAGDIPSALATLEQLAATSDISEVQDRASLEICRLRLEQGERSTALSAHLNRLRQSEVPYVQEQAAQLLNQL